MLKTAREWIDDKGFDFIITGEVAGQRPKSQRRDTMPLVQRDSGIGYRRQYRSLATTRHTGPLALIDSKIDSAVVELAARIVARYSKGRDTDRVVLEYGTTDGAVRPLHVLPIRSDDMPHDGLI